MLSLFCLFTVIGGKNIYLRLSVSEECDNKDFVWEMLQKEVLYSVALRVFNLGKNGGRKNMFARVLMRDGNTWGGCGRGFPPLAGVVQGASPRENVEHLHAPRCDLVIFRLKKLLLQSLYT